MAASAVGPASCPRPEPPVCSLQRLDELKAILGGEKVAFPPERIGRDQQIPVRRVVALWRAPVLLKRRREPGGDERAVKLRDRRHVSGMSGTPYRRIGGLERSGEQRATGGRAARRRLLRQPLDRIGSPALGAAGIGRPNRSDRYSMRVRACSNTALNSRCSRRLSRRMSTMKAIEGRSRAIYEKF